MSKTPITVARGDGIGPEIMDATLRILEAAGAQIEPEFITIGEQAFKQGIMNGLPQEAQDSIARTGILLKAPITTPQGGGYKSVNVTLRKMYGLFANVRPVKTLTPYVPSKHDNVDMVIVRENEEDLYAGVEYRQTRETCHAMKLLSHTGTEMIVRYAFEFAKANGRKKVTCLIKDNIMKTTDGMFHSVFKRVAAEYPGITAEGMIVDIGMAKIADTPEKFDVVVTLNLYGDIVSDIASQISGSVGLAGSFNIGDGCAMFEAVHGSAPDIAGQGIANPSGLLNGALLMLDHIGQGDVATKIEQALMKTIEDGMVTGDIARNRANALGTAQFADAVIANLGQAPAKLPVTKAADKKKITLPTIQQCTIPSTPKTLDGVDVYVDWPATNGMPDKLGALIETTSTSKLKFQAMSNRGVQIYPGFFKERHYTDFLRCRFMATSGSPSKADIREVLIKLEDAGIDWVKIETLQSFGGEAGYSKLQGQG